MFEKADAGKIDQVIDMAFRIVKVTLINKKQKTMRMRIVWGLPSKSMLISAKTSTWSLAKIMVPNFDAVLFCYVDINCRLKINWKDDDFNGIMKTLTHYKKIFFWFINIFFNLFFNIFQSYFTVQFHKTSHINTPMAGRYLLAQR